MTASALNVASIAPTAQPGAGAAVNTAGAGPLAGFEALLATLFPQADPTAAATGAGQVATPAIPGAPVKTDAVKTDGLTDPKDGADRDKDATTETPLVGAPSIGDAAAALAASLMAAQPAKVDTPITTTKNPNATVAPASQDKSKGLAAFALAAPQPAAAADTIDANPDVAAKVGEAVDADAKAPVATPAKATATQTAPLTQPHQAAAAAPAPAPAPTPQVQPQATQAVATDTPVVETAQAETAVLAAGQVPTTETAPAPTPNTRTAKSDRAKGPGDVKAAVSDDMKPVEAGDKPAHGKTVQAAQAAAKDASTVEAAEARPEETKVEAETADPMMQVDARPAASSSTPTAAPIHGVRAGPETVANLAAQILKKTDGKTSRFDVELNPHGLGKVDVRIEIGAHGRITAGMTFDNPQAAADVKARAAELQSALEQAGFDISGGISFDVAGERGQQQQNQAWQDQSDTSRAFQGRAFRAALDTAGDAAEAANQGALRLRRGMSAGVDVRI